MISPGNGTWHEGGLCRHVCRNIITRMITNESENYNWLPMSQLPALHVHQVPCIGCMRGLKGERVTGSRRVEVTEFDV